MAECSYARCLLERQLIKRELMKWSKDMLHIVGLERIAEELMGRRKWKLFQEIHTQNHMSIENTATARQKNFKGNVDHDLPINFRESQDKSHSAHTVQENHNSKKLEQQNCEEKENGTDHHKEHHEERNQIESELTNNLKDTDSKNLTNASQKEQNNRECNNTTNGSSLISKPDITEGKIEDRSTRSKSPLLVEPIDWKPDEKCNFCINGNLLSVNEKGELVAESGPAMSETDTQRLETDTDSDGGTTEGGSVKDSSRLHLNKLLTSRQRDFPGTMTSINSVAPNLAAIQSLSGQYFQNINWLQLAQQTSQQLNSTNTTTSDISAAALSPSLKDSPSPSDVTGEQPLDLSSKPSPNSPTSGDLKATRPKLSRSSSISSGRQPYSNEDLNAALQDLLAGKVAGRKTASRHCVPKSTLRNKMYKAGSLLGASYPVDLLQLQREMGIENSDEDFDADSNASAPQPSTGDGHQNFEEATRAAALKKVSENNGRLSAMEGDMLPSNSSKTPLSIANKLERDSSPTVSEGLEQVPLASAMVDKKRLLQVFYLLSRSFSGLDDKVPLRDLFSALIVNSSVNPTAEESLAPTVDDSNTENPPLNNGNAANLIVQRLLMQQKIEQQQRTSPFRSGMATSDTPETNSSLDPSESFDDQASILKIPSYKPVAGSSNAREPSVSPSLNNNNNNNNNNCSANSNLHRNGDSPHSAASPRIPNPVLAASSIINAGNNSNLSISRQSNLSVISPPLASHNSLSSADSQSPPSFSLRDVITNSIQRTMSEQVSKDAQAAAASMLGLTNDANERNANASNDYKKPSISVVKNIGGTDTSRFGSAPNLLAVMGGGSNAHNPLHHNPQSQFHLPQHHHSLHSPHHLSRQEAAALAAGKGTRPKRGKYRNYDRDSLVEAVKAVQRGEMSVHRAGSYYGVPHSTLEYKVKERHLMRPRKREPKPQPGLDSTTGNSSSVASSSKSTSNISGLNSLEKIKASGGSTGKLNNSMKNNSSNMPAFPGAGPNGINLPIFDPATVAAQLQYPANLFWQHSPAATFSQLHMDFNRTAAAQVSAANASVNTEILKTHMQRYNDEALRAACETIPRSTNSPSSPTAEAIALQNPHTLNLQNAREIAENLYESGGTNGSLFLDGIIRKTLSSSHGSNSGGGSSGALLDQLVKKSPLPFTNNRCSDYVPSTDAPVNYEPAFLAGIKRSSSPPAFPGIKRERTSPPPPAGSSSANSDDEGSSHKAELVEHNNNRKGDHHGNGRTSHGSESADSDLAAHLTQNTHTNHSTKMDEINGDSVMPKRKNATSPTQPQPQQQPQSEPLTQEEMHAINATPTSILQEKLAQIKAEQENEVNL